MEKGIIHNKLRPFVAATALMLGASACADTAPEIDYEVGRSLESEDGVLTTVTTEDVTTTERNTTTTEAERIENANATIDNVWNTDYDEFQCLDEGNATGTMLTFINTEDGNTAIVGQLNRSDLNVDRDARTQNNMLWSESLVNPMTGDISEQELFVNQLGATHCENAEAIGAALYDESQTVIDGVPVTDRVEWLSEFADMKIEDLDEFVDTLRVPYPDAESLTPEQYQANLDATERRVFFAEKLANANMQKEFYGIMEDVQISSGITVDTIDGVYNPDDAEFVVRSSYQGDAAALGITHKPGDCALVIDGYNPDDQSPIEITSFDESCDDEPETPTTTVPTTNPPATNPPTTPVVETTIDPEKIDDEELPNGQGDEAENDGGTADVAGEGEAGQDVSPDGTIVSETLPPAQSTTTTAPRPTTTEAHEQNTASTNTTPSTTNPPVVETAPTTVAQTGALPVAP